MARRKTSTPSKANTGWVPWVHPLEPDITCQVRGLPQGALTSYVGMCAQEAGSEDVDTIGAYSLTPAPLEYLFKLAIKDLNGYEVDGVPVPDDEPHEADDDGTQWFKVQRPDQLAAMSARASELAIVAEFVKEIQRRSGLTVAEAGNSGGLSAGSDPQPSDSPKAPTLTIKTLSADSGSVPTDPPRPLTPASPASLKTVNELDESADVSGTPPARLGPPPTIAAVH